MVEHNLEVADVSGVQPLDATAAQALAVDGVVPRFVAAPRSIEELGEVLRTAAEQGWAVSPRGAGTKMGLGNPPRALDLVLDLRGLRGLVDYTPAHMTGTVGAGTPLAALEAELAVARPTLAPD